MQGFFSRVGRGAMKVIGSLKEPVKKLGQVGYNVGKFAVQNHATLAPLLHGVAMASGNQSAQKITGGLLSLSQMAQTRQKLNEGNERARQEMAKGGYGAFNHATGKMTSYK